MYSLLNPILERCTYMFSEWLSISNTSHGSHYPLEFNSIWIHTEPKEKMQDWYHSAQSGFRLITVWTDCWELLWITQQPMDLICEYHLSSICTSDTTRCQNMKVKRIAGWAIWYQFYQVSNRWEMIHIAQQTMGMSFQHHLQSTCKCVYKMQKIDTNSI